MFRSSQLALNQIINAFFFWLWKKKKKSWQSMWLLLLFLIVRLSINEHQANHWQWMFIKGYLAMLLRKLSPMVTGPTLNLPSSLSLHRPSNQQLKLVNSLCLPSSEGHQHHSHLFYPSQRPPMTLGIRNQIRFVLISNP